MDAKTVKDFLMSYKNASRRALQLEIEIEQLRLNKMSPAGVAYDSMPKSHRIIDLSEYAAKVDDLLIELRGQYDECLEKKRLIILLIEEAPTETERMILWDRYVSLEKNGMLKSYERIAVERGYSYAGVKKILNRAYMHLAEKWPEISEKYDKFLPD